MDDIAAQIEALMRGLPTRWLIRCAIEGYAKPELQMPLWKRISVSQEDARDYYASLDDETARWDAAEVLVLGGWTRSDVCFRHS